jgi:hypothetical protein
MRKSTSQGVVTTTGTPMIRRAAQRCRQRQLAAVLQGSGGEETAEVETVAESRRSHNCARPSPLVARHKTLLGLRTKNCRRIWSSWLLVSSPVLRLSPQASSWFKANSRIGIWRWPKLRCHHRIGEKENASKIHLSTTRS